MNAIHRISFVPFCLIAASVFVLSCFGLRTVRQWDSQPQKEAAIGNLDLSLGAVSKHEWLAKVRTQSQKTLVRRSQPRTRLDQAPERRAPRVQPTVVNYQIRKGDILGNIAQRYYGSSQKVDIILKANPGLDPLRLRPGKSIKIPNSLQRPNAVYEVAAVTTQRKYRVKEGDCLSIIAERELGSMSHVSRIRALNPNIKNDQVRIGDILVLPVRGV